MSTQTLDPMRVKTPVGTLSYPHIAKPQKAQKEGDKEKYSVVVVFAPGTDLSALKAAAIAAAKDKFGATVKGPGGKAIPTEKALADGVLKSPFRTDAAAKGYPEGSTFISARSDRKPQAVYSWPSPEDPKKPAKIDDADIVEQLYAGSQVIVSLRAFGYDTSGNRGVSFALNNIQKRADGERLDNRVAAEDEFDADLSSVPESIDDVT